MSDAELGARLGRIHRRMKLDEGGRGEVWSALCQDHGDVAIKIFTLDEQSGTEEENAQFSAELSRAISILPNVRSMGLPRVHDGGVLKGAAFIVMEHLRGESLRSLLQVVASADPSAKVVEPDFVERPDDNPSADSAGGEVKSTSSETNDGQSSRIERLREEQRLSEVDVLRMARDLFSALAALNEASLVHGDVLLQHIFLAESGEWMLLGAGTRRAEAKRSKEMERLLLMAPERLRGQRPDAQGDVYSVGVLLFRVLNGVFPYQAKSPIRQVSLALTGVANPFFEMVSDDVKKLLERSFERDAMKRPSAAILAEEAETLLESRLTDDETAEEALDVAAQTKWCMEQMELQKIANVVERLNACPELLTQSSLTASLWEVHADALLRPLYEGKPILRSAGLLLASLKESVPDLIALVADTENMEQTRVTACRLLALAEVPDALPYIVPLLNEPFAWLQRAAFHSVVQLDASALIAYSSISEELTLFLGNEELCRPMNGEDNDANQVKVPANNASVTRLYSPEENVEILPAFACESFAKPRKMFRTGVGFFAAQQYQGEMQEGDVDEECITLLCEDASFELQPYTMIRLGSAQDCDVVVEGLEPHHATLEHVGDGQLSIRCECSRVDDEQGLESVLESGETGSVVFGHLQILASFEDPRIMLYAHPLHERRIRITFPKGAVSFSAGQSFDEVFDEPSVGLVEKVRGLFRRK